MRNVVHAIRDYMGYCRYQKRLSNNTMRAYSIDMNQFIDYLHDGGLDNLDVHEVTKDILKVFVERLQLQYAVRTCKRKIACVKPSLTILKKRITCFIELHHNRIDAVTIRRPLEHLANHL